MQYKIYRFVLLISLLLWLTSCAAQPEAGSVSTVASSSGATAPSNTITAVKVDTLTTDSAAAYWANAPVSTVHTKATEKGKADGPDVNIQAAYDGKNIAMRLEWADTTESNLNKAWTWDGSKFSRSKDLGDRMGVLFPIENNANFSSKGCAGACHNLDADPEKWWMGSESADSRFDLWQWTAASSNPVGQAQDEWMGAQEDPADMESATHSDALKSGGSVSNVNKAKDGPAFMGNDLSASFIITGEQTPIDTSKLTQGAVIPPSILAPWVGSRGDVQAKGVWKDGKWVVVLLRALDTGNDEDLVLTPPKAYPLGVAVFDHIDLVGHTTTADVLTLEWK
ncbi:MAG: ethylbenzene dehydrogenase-related protein [Chloroflexi bacterium]|nr:ethylbenzene dehydrogenase-related protein [Chloroflexota bacterium]